MDLSALLTSAGINIAITVTFFIIYSVLRKQPSFLAVYYGGRAELMHKTKSTRSSSIGSGNGDSSSSSNSGSFSLERFVPSPSWIVKAWETSEQEIVSIGGLDGMVFVRIIIFSIRIFSIAALVCLLVVLPVNYYGRIMVHDVIPSEALEVFTIANVKYGSKWVWVHCLALHIISCSACVLLYFEYKHIAELRIRHITTSPPNPSHFTVLVRSIPWSEEESYCETVKNFFTKYYGSSYLTHQIVYKCGKVQKLISKADLVYHKMFKSSEGDFEPDLVPCNPCNPVYRTRTGSKKCVDIVANEAGDHRLRSVKGKIELNELNLATRKKYDVAGSKSIQFKDLDLSTREKLECAPAAFVTFKTRHAASNVVAEVLQSSNPMLWVTEMAPEPQDILWSNLCIPYKQIWVRRTAIRLAVVLFMSVFMVPVLLVQSMTAINRLSKTFPFLRGFLKHELIIKVVQGYLPSVVLVLFLLAVPPTMILFSKLEGSVSRSGRKRSACIKVLFFTFWIVFFANVLSGSFIDQLNAALTSVKDISTKIAQAVPNQAAFFTTYVLTTGWAGLSAEIMQPFIVLCNFIRKFVFKIKGAEDTNPPQYAFPYHTEVPRLLVFGCLGFTCAVLIPLILPFLLIYYSLAYLVYKNQIINVYVKTYDTGGQYWPVAHTTTIVSLVMAEVIALAIFVSKNALIAAGFTLPTIVGTLLFNLYCRRRFLPSFKKMAAQVIMDMDREDEQSGRMEEIHRQLQSSYCQFWLSSHDKSCKKAGVTTTRHPEDQNTIRDLEMGNVGDTSHRNTIQDPESCKAGDTSPHKDQNTIQDPESCKAGDTSHHKDQNTIQDPESCKAGDTSHHKDQESIQDPQASKPKVEVPK